MKIDDQHIKALGQDSCNRELMGGIVRRGEFFSMGSLFGVDHGKEKQLCELMDMTQEALNANITAALQNAGHNQQTNNYH